MESNLTNQIKSKLQAAGGRCPGMQYFDRLELAINSCKKYIYSTKMTKFIASDKKIKLESDNYICEILNKENNKYFQFYLDIDGKSSEILNKYPTNEDKELLINKLIESLTIVIKKKYLIRDDLDDIVKFKIQNQEQKLSYHLIFKNISFSCLKCMKRFLLEIIKNSFLVGEFGDDLKIN